VPEREVKLAAAPSFRLPDLTNAVEGAVVEDLAPRPQRTTYFDTPDLRLARWGASLRYRDTDGWTVKLPNTGSGSMLVREEIGFEGDPKEPPSAAVDLLRAYVRTEKLAPVTRLRTLRRSVILRDGSGREDTEAPADGELPRIAEVVDDEVSVMDGRRLAARFRELEVEAAAGTPDEAVDHILARLRAAGAGEPDPTPKYVRALGPRATEPAEVAVADLQSGATAGAVVRQALAASVIRLLRHDAIVRLGTDDEGVHQARVATRRLRSDLRTFGSLLDPGWTAALVEELRWLGDKLGAARDADVLLDRLTERVHLLDHVDAQAAGRLLAQLAQARDTARTDLLAALREPRYAEALDRLVDAANQPALLLEADLPAATVLPRLVRMPWKKLRRAVRDLDDPPGDDQLHAVRIRAKRLRYAAEAVAPLLGKPARELAEMAAGLQEILGEHNDAVVAVRWLRGPMSNGRSVRTAFVAGELAGLEQWAAAETRGRWRAAWKRLKDRRLRTWM
jgi:CHAD domain-containing protein